MSYSYASRRHIALRSASVLVIGVAVASAASVAHAQTASAATPGDESANQVEDVVVTARKFTETAQDVPAALSAIGADEIKARQIETIGDLQFSTPSFQTTQRGGYFMVAIRGVPQTTSSIVQDASVGIYKDGVYNASILGSAIGASLDVDRVEVLRGPQGTLYGKNTTAGAVAYYYKTPTDQFEGEFTAEIGNYNATNVSGIVNVPLVEGKLALRLAGSINEHGGYWKDAANHDSPLSDLNEKFFRATLQYDATDKLQFILRADAAVLKQTGEIAVPVYVQPGSRAHREITTRLYGAAAVNNPTLMAQALDQYNLLVASAPDYLRSGDIHRLGPNATRDEVANGSLTINYDAGPFQIKSISAARWLKDERQIDGAGGGLFNYYQKQAPKARWLTQELQVVGSALDDKLKYSLGAFYYYQSGYSNLASYLLPATSANLFTYAHNRIRDRSPAVFGQVTYAITPTLNLTGGLRWTRETKEVSPSLIGYSLAPDGQTGPVSCRTATNLNPCVLNFSTTSENVSYTFSADWQITPDAMVYARTGRGYKSGFVNESATTSPATSLPILPEQVTDYEIGLKSDWLNRRLRINLDYYRTYSKNLQKTVSSLFNGAVVRLSTNAGAAVTEGVELEARAIITPEFRVYGTVAMTDPKYTNYVDAGTDQSFQRFQGISKWTESLTAQYTRNTGFGSVRGQVDWYHMSSVDLAPSDSPGAITTANVPGPGTPDQFRIRDGVSLWNASATITFDKYNADLTFWIKNITNEYYFQQFTGTVNAGVGFAGAIPNPPRTFGVSATYRFQ